MVVVLALVLAAGAFVGNYFFSLAINTRSDKSVVFKAGHNALDLGENYNAKLAGYAEWFQTLDHADWRMTSHDNLDLHAYALPGTDSGGTWVIICHGYNGHGLQMLEPAYEFHRRGYNVLLPDARGLGRSGGRYTGMGWLDRLDILDWIGEINRRHSPANIFLYGVSMGGATVVMAAGESLPENVRAVVSDCGYSSVVDEFTYQLDKLYGLPAFPFMDCASLVTRIRAGYWLGEASAVRQAARSAIPILFIHGSNDAFVPVSMAEQLHDAVTAPKQKLVVDGAGHAGSAAADPVLYWGTIDSFLAKYSQ
jgi:Lysophospholipase